VGITDPVHRPNRGRNTISINASPVRDTSGAIIAAVSTYSDITDAKRAYDAASYLAKAGELLERFDPATSLQSIIDLAVPISATLCA
jgi:hypothetical protein